MAAVGDAVFVKGVSGGDIWDDTALVKAYDKAVSQMKDHLGLNGEAEEENEPANHTKKKHKKNRKGKQARLKEKMKKAEKEETAALQWHVGDSCRAAFTEDGLIYSASIISIDEQSGTCTVRYHGYGNEEQQELAALMPPGAEYDSFAEHSHRSEADSMEWRESISGSSTPRPSSRSTSFSHQSSGRGRGWGFPPIPPFPGITAGMSMMPPPMCPPMPASYPGWPSHSAPAPSAFPAVPPPPMIHDHLPASDREALHSMLISWYMSGYHTGFYQGLKNSSRQSGSRHHHHHHRRSKNKHHDEHLDTTAEDR